MKLTLEETDLMECLIRYPHLIDENRAYDILAKLVEKIRPSQKSESIYGDILARAGAVLTRPGIDAGFARGALQPWAGNVGQPPPAIAPAPEQNDPPVENHF